MYRKFRTLLASAEQARLFSSDKYEWYVYIGKKTVRVQFRGKDYEVRPGDKFGVRDATSSPGKYRLVLESLGTNRVMTPDARVVDSLVNNSKMARS